MRLGVPRDLETGDARVQLLYEGRDAADWGISMQQVICRGPPFAILNLETMLMTDLRTGKRKVIGKSWYMDGKLNWDAKKVLSKYSRYHYVEFSNREDALEHMRMNHPEVELQPPEFYFS